MNKKTNSRGRRLSSAERQQVFWEGMRRCVLSMGALIKKYQLDPLVDERRTTIDERKEVKSEK